MEGTVSRKLFKIFTRNISKKTTSPAHLRNIENKLLFGKVLETSKEKKKRVKRQKKEGLPLQSVGSSSPNSEEYWLTHIASKDIKVYRRTLSGRYKEVDKDKVFHALKQEKVEELSALGEMPLNDIAFPEVILKNLRALPMLGKTNKSDSASLDVIRYPSVTKILSETMSQESKAALERWKQKMILELGEEGFVTFNKEQMALGAKFHMAIKMFLEGLQPEFEPSLQKIWTSVQSILDKVTKVQLLEAEVAHPNLCYKGIVDCVASYKDVPSVIEWKLSGKGKSHLSATYDAPLQLSAYLGALSYDQNYPKNIRNGVVVVAYKDGSPANAFPMTENVCQHHWMLWLRRLQLYWETAAGRQM